MFVFVGKSARRFRPENAHKTICHLGKCLPNCYKADISYLEKCSLFVTLFTMLTEQTKHDIPRSYEALWPKKVNHVE